MSFNEFFLFRFILAEVLEILVSVFKFFEHVEVLPKVWHFLGDLFFNLIILAIILFDLLKDKSLIAYVRTYGHRGDIEELIVDFDKPVVLSGLRVFVFKRSAHNNL